MTVSYHGEVREIDARDAFPCEFCAADVGCLIRNDECYPVCTECKQIN